MVQKARHVGLATAAAIMAVCIAVFRRDIDLFLALSFATCVGVMAYAIAYVVWVEGVFDEEGTFDEEQGQVWLEPIEQVAVQTNRPKRIIVNGQITEVPEAIRKAVDAIIVERERGNLQTISGRELHGLAGLSRYNGSTQAVLEWLEDMGLISKEPRSVGEWIGDIHYYSPTPQPEPNGDGRPRSATTTATA